MRGERPALAEKDGLAVLIHQAAQGFGCDQGVGREQQDPGRPNPPDRVVDLVWRRPVDRQLAAGPDEVAGDDRRQRARRVQHHERPGHARPRRFDQHAGDSRHAGDAPAGDGLVGGNDHCSAVASPPRFRLIHRRHRSAREDIVRRALRLDQGGRKVQF